MVSLSMRMNRFQKADWLLENDCVFYFGRRGRTHIFVVKGNKEKFYSVKIESYKTLMRGHCRCDYIKEDCSHVLSCKKYLETHKVMNDG